MLESTEGVGWGEIDGDGDDALGLIAREVCNMDTISMILLYVSCSRDHDSFSSLVNSRPSWQIFQAFIGLVVRIKRYLPAKFLP
jgi:hypothetical protein